MTTIASRDLRNRTAEVLRQVADGTVVTITVHGAPVADLSPHRSGRRTSMTRAEMLDIVRYRQADPGLRDELEELAGDDTDSLGPTS